MLELLLSEKSGAIVKDIHARNLKGFSAIHYASAERDASSIELLLEATADINQRTAIPDASINYTPLDLAQGIFVASSRSVYS